MQVGERLVEGVREAIEYLRDVRVVRALRCIRVRVRGGHVTRDGVVGLHREPALIDVGGQVGPSDAQEQHRDVFVRARETGIEIEDAAVAAYRFIAPSLPAIQVAEVVPGLGIVRLLAGRVGIGELGGLLVVAGQKHVAEVVPGVRVGRRQNQRSLDEVDRLVDPPLSHAQHAEIVQGVDVFRLLEQQIQVDRLRFAEASLLVVRDGVVDGVGHGGSLAKGG